MSELTLLYALVAFFWREIIIFCATGFVLGFVISKISRRGKHQ